VLAVFALDICAAAMTIPRKLFRRRTSDAPGLRLRLALMTTAWAWSGLAAAQVYTGTLANGTVVLSNVPSAEAALLLIEAAAPRGPTSASQDALAGTAGPALPGPRAKPDRIFVPTLPSHFLPLFLAVARDHRLSAALLASVAAAESAFDPRALSPKGAAGLMQLMPATARRFNVGNRYSPLQSLNGGAAYLRWLSDRYGNDLPRVVAAYNAGEQAVTLANGVPPYPETQVYVQRVLHYLKHFSEVMSTDG
jgi:soluble lytic murein transglycosylase-like protein